MARTKEAKPSRSSYFKQLFAAHPELLRGASNDAILERWKEDHPSEEVSNKTRAILSNTKSVMRRKLGIKRKRRRRKDKVAVAMAAPKTVSRPRGRTGVLESLESKIDDVLALARDHEASGLEGVIKHLRYARNGVVMKQGSV